MTAHHSIPDKPASVDPLSVAAPRPTWKPLSRMRRPYALLSLATAALLTACSAGTNEANDAGRAAGQSAAVQPTQQSTQQPGAAALPSSHVHGVGIDPGDGLMYLATHDGLFRYEGASPVRIGPVNDLMGFTIAGPGHYYASGHPGTGSDLPDPVGLIESRDGGNTWQQLSRQGQSDFHALTASSGAVVGYDGTLRTSSDGTTWTSLSAPVQPYALTSSPEGAVLLATSEDGPVRSTDAGATWSSIPDAPLLMLVAWVRGTDNTVVGIAPDGQVQISTDAGLTWSPQGRIDGTPQALGANTNDGGGVHVQVVNDTSVLVSSDSGNTFTPLPATSPTEESR